MWVVAGWVKGKGKVVPWSQAGNWSRNQGERGVGGLAGDEVEGGGVPVAGGGGEALGGAEGVADLADGGGVAGLGDGAGADWGAEERVDERGGGEDGVIDLDGVVWAVAEAGEV